jgi:signal transduction histidine kinase
MGVRGQLNAVVAATTSLVLLAFLVPLGLLLRRAAEDRAIAAATAEAQATAALVALGQEPHRADGAGEGPLVTVFFADGRVVGDPTPRTDSIALAATGRAFMAESAGGVEVLVPVQRRSGGTAVVRAYAPESLLHRGVTRTWLVLGLLAIALAGFGLLLADRLGRRLVGSVTALAATADRLAAGDLTARNEAGATPELRRVGLELNRLAGRIQHLLTAAREEAADLAHRLRTPVAALRLNLDTLADAGDRARLGADVDALARLVDEVIRTARRPVREGAGARADLAGIAAERLAFWSALAEDVGRPVEHMLPDEPVPVRASPEDVAAALDALLENVFAHTPDRAALRVRVTAGPDGGGTITVEDAGPGLPTEPARRGVSAGGSTGLGLDIARRTAESSGGSMRTGTGPLGGALVELRLGPAE